MRDALAQTGRGAIPTIPTIPESPLTRRLREALHADLAQIVGSRWVRSQETDRLAYNNDCWPRGVILTRGRELWRNVPDAIAQPANAEQIARLVQWARTTGTPIVPYGAGSGVCGATVRAGGVVVDLKRLKGVVAVRREDMIARIRAGTIGFLGEKELERRGLTLGHYPSSLYCSSLGGYLAARSAGQYSSRYGKIEDMVLSMQVVTGSGEVLETAPNALARRPLAGVAPYGPDLTQLFVGSEGTLGLITEATMRVEPMPSVRQYRGFRFSRLSEALGAIRELMQQGLRPCVVRLYDAFDTLLAKNRRANTRGGPRSGAALVGRLGERLREAVPAAVGAAWKERVERASEGLLTRVVGHPLLLNRALELMPQDSLLVIGFEGTRAELVQAEAQAAFDLLGQVGMDLGEGPGLHWLENRFNVSYKQSPLFDAGLFVDTMEVSATWSNLEHVYWKVREAMTPHVCLMAHFSHVYPEGSSIYFSFVGFAPDLQTTLERYTASWQAGLDAVARAGGSIAHHHGIGQAKAPWTHHDHPGGRFLFEGLKHAFDPDGILNPGKVWPLEPT